MKTIKDICYSEEHKQNLDLYLPDEDRFSVFVYFHGGGLESGDKATGAKFIQYLTSHGVCVVSANYRMYPDAKYPDFLVDSAEAVAWVFKNIGSYGKAEKIFVGGSSAGGYISQMLCFDRRWLEPHGIKPADIAGYVHDAGQPTSHFNVLRERGLHKRRIIIDETAPLYYVGVDEEYSPMLIIVSDNDIGGRLEQTLLLNNTLDRFGHGDKYVYKLMSGKHCAYIKLLDENGESIFGKMICDFMFGEKYITD